DLLSYLKATPKDICLVALDFAGLSTDCHDIYQFVCDNTRIQKLVIDLIPSLSKVIIFDRRDIISKPEILEAFNCRPAPAKRSR
ncbi:hypothetical protein BDB00DRAFT_769367, partial [Zychaea mexicana]|uniref:uncharacterized protein n=1 Tax=Zychaea mexicana TaxID=64656 RepID=UPI0022FDB149